MRLTETISCSETLLLLGVCPPFFLCLQNRYQTAIFFRYFAHIKPSKTIKTIKTENIMHKHNMT